MAPGSVVGHWESVGDMPAVGDTVVLGGGRLLVLSEGGTTANLWDPITGAWKPTAGLNKSRTGCAAVTLADGRLLVTGGRNESDQSYSSSYIYDPSTGHWSKTGLLGTARTIPSAALLPDGRVLVAGGYYAVEPDLGQDIAPGTVLTAFEPRSNPGTLSFAPRLADVSPPTIGRAMATAELFDPATGTWSSTGSLSYVRAGAQAVTLADGGVLVVGSVSWEDGVDVAADSSKTAEIYDPATGRFSLTGPLPQMDWSALEKAGHRDLSGFGWGERSGGGALLALADGGAILIGHGDTWWHGAGIQVTRSFRFDAVLARWTEVGQTYAWVDDYETGHKTETAGVRNLEGAAVAQLPDGRILVAGGVGPNRWDATAVAQLYDSTTDSWSDLPPMPKARRDGSALVLTDGSILVLGGSGDDGPLASAIRFVPER
jgi:hypothetical protein